MFTEIKEFEKGCQLLANKLKRYLITSIGKTLEDANIRDIYHALSLALREDVMVHWLATWRSYRRAQVKMLFYLSMEYLPGKLTSCILSSLKADSALPRILEIIGRSDCLNKFSERDPALGNGGLGRLAACIIESLSTAGYPAIGYGLRYQYGLFEQEIWNGKQVERPDWWLEDNLPWEFRRDTRGQLVRYFGRLHLEKNIRGEEIGVINDSQNVRALAFDIPIVGYSTSGLFNVNTLRLWSTRESPRNFELQRFNAGELDMAAENITLTDVLYPADHHEVGRRMRIKQEYLLVSASIKDIIRRHKSLYGTCENLPDKSAIQINDTHPALSVAEMMHQLIAHEQMPWKQALEITEATLGYTNHTIMKEALEEWPQNQLQQLLPRQYRIIERLNQDFCEFVRAKFPGDEEKIKRTSILQDGKVRMAHLAFIGSHKVNGVAKLHADILKSRLFKDFDEIYPNKLLGITNGVTQRKWMMGSNPKLYGFITKYLGDSSWICDMPQLRNLEKFAHDLQFLKEYREVKIHNKKALIDYMHTMCFLRNKLGEPKLFTEEISTEMIFDVQIKRIHEYKRQLMNILHVILLYQEMLENPLSRIPRLVLFAGKAAASYEMAKRIISLICAVARTINNDARLNGRLKVYYFENYNVTLAEKIIPAADLSEQISTAGFEASGTSNMKFAMNGALTIGTEDGANVEMRQAIGDEAWPFSFGASCEEITKLQNGNYYPQDIYREDLMIRKVLDTLIQGTFSQNDEEARHFEEIYQHLVGGGFGADPYFILHDLPSYIQAQRKVDTLYADPVAWAKQSLLNMTRMDYFSVDRCIHEYASKVWKMEPHPMARDLFDNAISQFYEYSTFSQK